MQGEYILFKQEGWSGRNYEYGTDENKHVYKHVNEGGVLKTIDSKSGTLTFNNDVRDNPTLLETAKQAILQPIETGFERKSDFTLSDDGKQLVYSVVDTRIDGVSPIPDLGNLKWDQVQDTEGVFVQPDDNHQVAQFFDGNTTWLIPTLSAASHIALSPVWKRHINGERVPQCEMADSIFEALGYPAGKRCSERTIVRVLNFLLERIESLNVYVGPPYWLSDDSDEVAETASAATTAEEPTHRTFVLNNDGHTVTCPTVPQSFRVLSNQMTSNKTAHRGYDAVEFSGTIKTNLSMRDNFGEALGRIAPIFPPVRKGWLRTSRFNLSADGTALDWFIRDVQGAGNKSKDETESVVVALVDDLKSAICTEATRILTEARTALDGLSNILRQANETAHGSKA